MSNIKVWHIPQVPGKAFEVEVEDLKTAKLLCDVLGNYDAFQFKHNIKPDYCNVNGVSVLEEGEWWDVEASEMCEEWEKMNDE